MSISPVKPDCPVCLTHEYSEFIAHVPQHGTCIECIQRIAEEQFARTPRQFPKISCPVCRGCIDLTPYTSLNWKELRLPVLIDSLEDAYLGVSFNHLTLVNEVFERHACGGVSRALLELRLFAELHPILALQESPDALRRRVGLLRQGIHTESRRAVFEPQPELARSLIALSLCDPSERWQTALRRAASLLDP